MVTTDLVLLFSQDYQLPYIQVYGPVSSKLASAGMFDALKQLIGCVRDTGLSDAMLQDELVLIAMKSALASKCQSKDTESLTKLLKSDSAKVLA